MHDATCYSHVIHDAHVSQNHAFSLRSSRVCWGTFNLTLFYCFLSVTPEGRVDYSWQRLNQCTVLYTSTDETEGANMLIGGLQAGKLSILQDSNAFQTAEDSPLFYACPEPSS